MLKHLPIGYMTHLADYQTSHYFVALPPGIDFEDLFVPTFWAHHRKLRKHDIIRVVAPNAAFDIDLTVTATPTGGAVMRVRPCYGAMSGAEAVATAAKVADEVSIKTVPISRDGRPAVRAEFLPATQWRVLGLGGHEVVRGLSSEAEALKAMQGYLADAGLVMPSEAEIASAVAERDARDASQLADREARKAMKAKPKAAA